MPKPVTLQPHLSADDLERRYRSAHEPHERSWWQILWLLPLGYLVVTSGFFPKALGVLLIIGGFSWLAQFFVHFLAPDLARLASFLAIGAIGEVFFIVWPLVRGMRIPASGVHVPSETASASATPAGR
jgi:hypothetical protein